MKSPSKAYEDVAAHSLVGRCVEEGVLVKVVVVMKGFRGVCVEGRSRRNDIIAHTHIHTHT